MFPDEPISVWKDFDSSLLYVKKIQSNQASCQMINTKIIDWPNHYGLGLIEQKRSSLIFNSFI